MTWIFIYIIYSIGGYFFICDYYNKCAANDVLPFNESLFKTILASLFLGGITTLIMIFSVISVIWDSFKNTCEK